MLYLERRRAERAEKRFVLMLVDVRAVLSGSEKHWASERIMRTVCEITRETDIVGWYIEDSLIGVIGTEVGEASPHEIKQAISQKFHHAFSERLGLERASRIFVSFHFFPEGREEKDREDKDLDDSANTALYPDLYRKDIPRTVALGVKRAMDIAGSTLALLLVSPLFALIAVAIKVTSKGPVLFRQERLGQNGKKFTVLKFRSMRTGCDSQIHKEYVTRFIAGQVSEKRTDGEKAIFKLQKDPRITPIGRLLRKTSLDELPQFWNVMVGQMSLVGPRPPVEYEFKAYDVWHRRRVLEIKPGITGLWQVQGRSQTQFDDMVRLDLRYARAWTIWLDVKILLQTPAAVVSGVGAR